MELRQAILRWYKHEHAHWGVAIDGIHVHGFKEKVTAECFKSGEVLHMTKQSIDIERNGIHVHGLKEKATSERFKSGEKLVMKKRQIDDEKNCKQLTLGI